jgi:signal peptidase I
MKVFDFLNILAILTVFTGTVTLVDFFLQKKQKSHFVIIEYCRSFFPIFLIVLIIRSFLFQLYRVPTGSLEPTVMPGDLIFVSQYNYGLKLPLFDKVIFPMSHPSRGEIALFRWPVNPKVTFVKRVVGLPGDHISYINKIFYINGHKASQHDSGNFSEDQGAGQYRSVTRYHENLLGTKHDILINHDTVSPDFKNLVVPAGYYFMIGDNRDNSDDSRDWGFVPVNNFIGQARFVWFNIQLSPFSVQWHRIGLTL